MTSIVPTTEQIAAAFTAVERPVPKGEMLNSIRGAIASTGDLETAIRACVVDFASDVLSGLMAYQGALQEAREPRYWAQRLIFQAQSRDRQAAYSDETADAYTRKAEQDERTKRPEMAQAALRLAEAHRRGSEEAREQAAALRIRAFEVNGGNALAERAPTQVSA